MTPRLESAEYLSDYRIRVRPRFADGRVGEFVLADELWGEVFEPLKDAAVFRRFRVDSELNTIAWETGADLAPEYLYEKALPNLPLQRADLRPGAERPFSLYDASAPPLNRQVVKAAVVPEPGPAST